MQPSLGVAPRAGAVLTYQSTAAKTRTTDETRNINDSFPRFAKTPPPQAVKTIKLDLRYFKINDTYLLSKKFLFITVLYYIITVPESL